MREKFNQFALKRAQICFFLAGFLCLFTSWVSAQVSYGEVSSSTNVKSIRDRGLQMLDQIKDVIKENYYDQNFHGINLDDRFKTAAARVKTMDTNSQVFRVIAQVLIEFNDSHTGFIPPARTGSVVYGFSMQMIANDCFIVDVDKGSDAEAKGLQPGDIILRVGSYMPTRDNLWKIRYLMYALDPQAGLKLAIRSLDGKNREVEVLSKVMTPEERRKKAESRKAEEKEKCQEISAELIACRLPTFEVESGVIDKMMKEVGSHKKFILDLRGNPGGYVDTEKHLAGYFFDHDVKIGDQVMRKKSKEVIAKSRKDKAFLGELMVLIDSDAASAAEVFARTIQIEKRGKVVGDVSAGAVMTAQYYPLVVGHATISMETLAGFGVSVTIGDLIMSDGTRLEGSGVIPDLPVGPTGYALSKKTDPVLSFAASRFGASLTSEKAGGFYFMRKKPENEPDDQDHK